LWITLYTRGMDEKDKIIAELKTQVQTLLERIKELEEEIARLRKNSNNSSKPPSSDIVKPKRTVRKVSRKKRKRGGQFGHRKFTRQPFKPEEIDKTIEYELKDKDAVGLELLDEWFVVQQVELPEKMYQVTEHRARKYFDPVTGQVHITALPDEIRKGGLLGARFTAMIAFMKAGCHASYGTIRQFCQEMYGLDISRGMLSKTVQKVSHALQEPYEHLFDQLPYQDYLGVDETGHKNESKLHWSWCFQNDNFSVFHIHPSRGSVVLKKVLGETFNGTERAIRQVVIDRHVTQGTCGHNGMRWCERAWTIIATCKKQSRNVFEYLHDAVIAHWTQQNSPLLLC